MLIYLGLSSHGFGHAARQAAVLMGGQLYMFDTLEEAKQLYDYETQG